MKHIKILHPINGINHLLEENKFEYDVVCIIQDCESLEQAFELAQNDLNPSYASLNIRSTSIGDVMIDNDNNHWLIKSNMFQQIPKSFIEHVDWEHHLTLNPV